MAYTAEQISSRVFIRGGLDFDPNSGSETAVTLNPADTEDYLALDANGAPKNYLFQIRRTVGTDGITTATVYAATSAAGANNVAVAAITPTTADAVDDTVNIEVDADQIRAALAGATHIGLEIDLETSTDECNVTVVGTNCQHEFEGLTADFIS
jgi:hypothetical protein